MDILISSNLERYLFELFGREARAVAYCMYRLNEGGESSVTAEALDQIREEFAAYSCDDQKTLDTIREIHDRCGYVMDTHTAAVSYTHLDVYKRQDMIDAQSIQWFPGHMAKTRRLMRCV